MSPAAALAVIAPAARHPGTGQRGDPAPRRCQRSSPRRVGRGRRRHRVRGSAGARSRPTILAVAEEAGRTARAEHLPLVVQKASSGSDILEGIAALERWGTLAKALVDCSGVVPTIVVVDGPAVSGPALLLGVADLVVMTDASFAFVNGPVMVAEFTGVHVSAEELGGAGELARHTGVPALVVATRQAAVDAVADLLGYLPDSVDAEPPAWPADDPVDRPCPE